MKLTGILGGASLAALAMAGGAQAADKYVVGVSNTLIGNGWREEMICSIKAEAEASGKVSKVVVANRNGGPSEQIADIRNLISAGANIIIINPSDREALNPVIKQAADKGIVVVAVDQAVSAPRGLCPDQRSGRIRQARRQMAVRQTGRQGLGGRDARHRRRSRRRGSP